MRCTAKRVRMEYFFKGSQTNNMDFKGISFKDQQANNRMYINIPGPTDKQEYI